MSSRNDLNERESFVAYYDGRYFHNETDFWEYVSKWPTEELKEDTAQRLLDGLKKDILINVFLKEIKFTNGEFRVFVDEIFLGAMKKLLERQFRV